MFVCSRCAGIYTGAFTAAIAGMCFATPEFSIKFLIVSFLPLFFDVTFTTIGLYSYSKPIAFSTGLLSGSVIYFIAINELEKLILIKKNNY
jgi:uncharacterized membrane protein